MKPERLQDAYDFKREIMADNGLSPNQMEKIHEAYCAFVKTNYQLKVGIINHNDYIQNKPSKHRE